MPIQKLTTEPKQTQELKTKQLPRPFIMLYQSILEKNTMELTEYLKQSLEENPFLESADSLLLDEDASNLEREEDSAFEELDTLATDDIQPVDQYDPEQQAFEDTEVWEEDVFDPVPSYSSFSDSEENEEWRNNPAAPVTFSDRLREQLRLLSLKPHEMIAGEMIIQNLNNAGLLEDSLKVITLEANLEILRHNLDQLLQHLDTATDLSLRQYRSELKRIKEIVDKIYIGDNEYIAIEPWQEQLRRIASLIGSQSLLPLLTIDDVERVRRIILEQLDPPGIAAINIQECLLAQLRRRDSNTEAVQIATRIIAETYPELLHHHFEAIQAKLQISEEQLRQALELLKQLNLRPGEPATPLEPSAIVPDFIVRWNEEDQDFSIRLNDATIPEIRMNAHYQELLNTLGHRKQAQKWLQQNHRKANYLIEALRQRRRTMLNIMTVIVRHQQEFFRTGDPRMLKPFVYRDIESITGLTISTISRTVRNKYVDTDYGIYPLRFFFSEGIPSTDGRLVAQVVIKEELRALIDSEPKDRPYTDEELAKKLQEKGYRIARRTVAKYREQMNIPPARDRRLLPTPSSHNS